VRNKATKKTICFADDIVFVKVDPETRQPASHGKTLEGLIAQTDDEVRKLNLNIENS
jgi:hypothetical protein